MISLLRNVIPDKVRIPSYITIIAAFVTIVQMFIKAFFAGAGQRARHLPAADCSQPALFLGRAEMFANKHRVLPSIVDGLGMGVGFTATLRPWASSGELLGSGTIFGLPVTAGFMDPILIFILPPGGFFVFGLLIALANGSSGEGKGPEEMGCAGCPAGGKLLKAAGKRRPVKK